MDSVRLIMAEGRALIPRMLTKFNVPTERTAAEFIEVLVYCFGDEMYRKVKVRGLSSFCQEELRKAYG